MQITSEEVFTRLRKLVAENKPFSLLRFGDGEGLFAFYYRYLQKRYIGASIKHWGELPRTMHRHNIAVHIKKAYMECDFAALPYGFDGEWWKKAVKGFEELSKKESCGLNIHAELDESGVLAELIKDRDVVVVGCRDVADKLMEMGAASVGHFAISAQYRFEANKPKIPFYKQVDEMEKTLKQYSFKGKICLLAAGVAGKHLGNIMRERGGMVIDIGSVVDKWAGVESRSWIKKAAAGGNQ